MFNIFMTVFLCRQSFCVVFISNHVLVSKALVEILSNTARYAQLDLGLTLGSVHCSYCSNTEQVGLT